MKKACVPAFRVSEACVSPLTQSKAFVDKHMFDTAFDADRPQNGKPLGNFSYDVVHYLTL
jgi:hypothetical protein